MPSSGFQLSALPGITATPAANAGVYDPQQSMKATEAAIALFKQLQNAPAQQQAEQSGFNLQTASNKAKAPIQGVLAGAQGAEAEAAIPEAKNRGVLAGLTGEAIGTPTFQDAFKQSKVLAPIQAGGAAAAAVNEAQSVAELHKQQDSQYDEASQRVAQANSMADYDEQDRQLAQIEADYPWLKLATPKAQALSGSIESSRKDAQAKSTERQRMQIASERAQALTESRDPETLKLLRAQALGTGDAATVAAIDARLAKLAAPSGRIPDETRIKNLEDAARDADASGDADTANALRGRIKVLTTRASGNTISAEDIKALAAGLGGGTAKAAPAGAPAGKPTAAAATAPNIAVNPEGGKSNAAPLTVQQASQLPPGTWFMGTDQKWHKRK